jgi:hypothetical protein
MRSNPPAAVWRLPGDVDTGWTSTDATMHVGV